MISVKKIKELARKENKKIGKKAIEKLNKYLKQKTKEILKNSARNADFSGRKIIKQEDVVFEN